MNYQLRRYELLNSKLFNMNYALRAYCSKAFPDAACGFAQDDTLDRQEVGGRRGEREVVPRCGILRSRKRPERVNRNERQARSKREQRRLRLRIGRKSARKSLLLETGCFWTSRAIYGIIYCLGLDLFAQ